MVLDNIVSSDENMPNYQGLWISVKDVTNTGNGEPGTGVWELMYSGNPLESSKWRSKEKARRETIWVKVRFHRLCHQMASTFL